MLTTATQLGTMMGAGVQGQAGDTTPPNLSNLPTGDSANGDTIHLVGVNNNTTSVLGSGNADSILVDAGDTNILQIGDGTKDQLFVGSGDGNALIAGAGAGDTLSINSGSMNELQAGAGAGDVLSVSNGDNNLLSVGLGDGDSLSVGSGRSNDLEAGNGNNDALSVSSGIDNMLHVGNGAQDMVRISGDHNTINVGTGSGDHCLIDSGNGNLVVAGDGASDLLNVGTGDANVLEAGNGAGDTVVIGVGDNNVAAVGNGAGDLINLQLGSTNTLLDGDGANDTILVGGQVGTVGGAVNSGNSVVVGNGDGDQVWGSLGNGNAYLMGAGSDLVHTGGGTDFVYVDNHIETATASDPFHQSATDSLAQRLYADGGNDTFAVSGTGLGTTVMTGGGGTEKYWFGGTWGNAVITDFNAARGDRVMVSGVSDPDITNLGPIETQYVHSAYDTANSGNVDLLITFGSTTETTHSITLIDFQPQDTANAFNNATFATPATAETALSQIFDFTLADNQAVTNEIAALTAQHLILH